MKKLIVSSGLIIGSIIYVLSQHLSGNAQSYNATQDSVAQNAPASDQGTPVTPPPPPAPTTSNVAQDTSGAASAKSSSAPVASTGQASPTQTPAQSAPQPAPAPVEKKTGTYNDGTYTGSSADAYYGNIQVATTIQNGAITDVRFLQYPNDRSTSRYINSQAMPYLKSEAIAAQSANVNIVSGATDSSLAFRQSLASALAQAKG